MTRDEIIELAKQVGCATNQTMFGRTDYCVMTEFELERFAQLVAASEREACAKVCEAWANTHCNETGECNYNNCDMTAVAVDLAEAIRSRT